MMYLLCDFNEFDIMISVGHHSLSQAGGNHGKNDRFSVALYETEERSPEEEKL